ncbi:hypothetical protein HWV23_00065 [Natronomonas halophila]|uniref:hypothetical protein n=1 Tax=Natronomonas halophila TaxID=2747817 RepID=UPI0015B6758B|nr:hypothetical protein [Natronomonas halophila]QLD84162.1 hypothetical protein HWV23_00065 [Natronomonas halophila]
MRIGAAAVVFGVFVGVGYLSRMEAFGLANLLDDQATFFTVAFLLIGFLSVGWLLIQRYRQ